MVSVGSQIQRLRKENGLNQAQLAERIGVSLTQLQRYENKGVQPPADILKKLADTFNTSIDFLVYGTSEQKAEQSISDSELLSQFKEVEKLGSEDRNIIKNVIDALIKRSKINQIAAL